MISCTGVVQTPNSDSYLMRLCKHFSKKILIEYGENKASAHFPFGHCQLISEASQTLSFHCEAENQTALTQMKTTIDHHVGMFTRQNPLIVTWSNPIEIETSQS